ncbi:MAG TPA: hypothetical protein VFV73_30260, partial [Streptosporangiaceae bacterium]|nr:hypothetical protein [Streptosporangiaceae bacterium]
MTLCRLQPHARNSSETPPCPAVQDSGGPAYHSHIGTAEPDLVDVLVPALYDKDGTFIARPDAWWPELGIAIEVDSAEWHISPEDHASTLARGRRMARCQIVVLRFTPKDAPVNNLMVRSQLACSFQNPGIAGSRRWPIGWPRFHRFSMITKDLIPGMGTKAFVIMKCLLKSRA